MEKNDKKYVAHGIWNQKSTVTSEQWEHGQYDI